MFLNKEGTDIDPKKVIKFALKVIGGIVLIVLFFNSFYRVEAGEKGILLTFGKMSDTTSDEGLHLKSPIGQDVVKMDVRTQKEEVDASAASRDLQTVNAKIALNYNVNPSMVKEVYQEFKQDYSARIIAPAIQEAIKAGTAKFTAEELITLRSEVKDQIKMVLKERLEPRGIVVSELSITNFSFSKSFDDAIEMKVTAEQEALASKNQLERIKFEAEQRVAKAQGEAEATKAEALGRAEAIRVEAEALENNPQLLELRAIEKWDGNLPTYMMGGQSVPFINIK